MKRNCNNHSCGKEYEADIRNINRGWGLCCSKSCAASLREKSKTNYNPNRVIKNNILREQLNFIKSHRDIVYHRTQEGYRIIGTTAVDEFDSPVYEIDPNEDNFYSNED